jgi:23S rRNA (cytidine1920-2'-O)/16S rRNA (cytidine1409-2'-O)-methyltransferase
LAPNRPFRRRRDAPSRRIRDRAARQLTGSAVDEAAAGAHTGSMPATSPRQQHPKEAERQRADRVLVARGLFATRAQAQAAIAAGTVRIAGEVLQRPAQMIDPASSIEAAPAHPFASRGGLKLQAALDGFRIDVAGLHCLDIGASTGGFTDVLLARGAAHVVAVDVGRGQLLPRLLADPRVSSLENTDARRLDATMLARPPAFVSADLSFISLAKVLPAVLPLAAPDALLVALVKPQFEVGRALVGSGGIVRDAAAREAALHAVCAAIEALGWPLLGRMDSPVAGGDGNHEYLVAARRAGER